MGLRRNEIQLIVKVLDRAKSISGQGALSVCCLGYPDLLISVKEARALCPFYQGELFVSSNSDATKKWHSVNNVDGLVCAESFFGMWGVKLVVIDVERRVGNEVILDLNQRDSTARFKEKGYDLVIDNGTLEHCFNIGEAFVNTVRLVKPFGGYILHINPVTMLNHGFYNLNPTLYFDFYSENSFDFLDMAITTLDGTERCEFHPTRRFIVPKTYDRANAGSVITVLARRREPRAKISFPTQAKYKKIA